MLLLSLLSSPLSSFKHGWEEGILDEWTWVSTYEKEIGCICWKSQLWIPNHSSKLSAITSKTFKMKTNPCSYNLSGVSEEQRWNRNEHGYPKDVECYFLIRGPRCVPALQTHGLWFRDFYAHYSSLRSFFLQCIVKSSRPNILPVKIFTLPNTTSINRSKC